jgi:hypothetical protein
MSEIIQHNTDDYPAVLAVPGQPVHIFGYVRYITDAEEAAKYLQEEEEDALLGQDENEAVLINGELMTRAELDAQARDEM